MASHDDDDDALSLPPSVTEGDVEEAQVSQDADGGASDESLPPAVEEQDPATMCCNKNCSSKFTADWMAEYELQFQQLPLQDRHRKLYQLVRQGYEASMKDKEGTGSTKISWNIEGIPVCRKFWEATHHIGHGAVDKLVAFAKAGQIELPSHAPRLGRSTPASDALDVWFIHLYQELAEPLAIPGSEDFIAPELDENGHLTSEVQSEVVKDVNHPLYAVATNAQRYLRGQSKEVKVPKRYLNFESLKELWQFYNMDEDMSKRVSRDTFDRGWKSWRNFMPFKNAGLQSKCTICAELSVARTEAIEAAARAELDLKKKQHLDVVMADRRVNVRGNKLASEEKVWKKTENDKCFMKVQLDGMDQSKFNLPRVRRLTGTSLLQKCWRPAMHITGCLVFGQIEYYAVLPPDCPKCSSMNSTILARVLDLLTQKLHKLSAELSLPPVLVINVDNTARESKNSFFGSFCATLVHRGIFQEVEVQYLQCDHTHNELDQRFSTMASKIRKADYLQDPDDLVQLLQGNMTAAAGRELVVEALPNTWNFKDWMVGYDLHAKGLTATHLEPYANHLWRFTKRYMMDIEDKDIQIFHPDWQDQAHPQDIILSVKQFMSSADLSQKPQLPLCQTVSFFLNTSSLSMKSFR